MSVVFHTHYTDMRELRAEDVVSMGYGVHPGFENGIDSIKSVGKVFAACSIRDVFLVKDRIPFIVIGTLVSPVNGDFFGADFSGVFQVAVIHFKLAETGFLTRLVEKCQNIVGHVIVIGDVDVGGAMVLFLNVDGILTDECRGAVIIRDGYRFVSRRIQVVSVRSIAT